MPLVLLVLVLLGLSLLANRYGVDTRDGRDWASSARRREPGRS